MNEKFNKMEEQDFFLKGATASLFALCTFIIFRMVVLKELSFDLLIIAFTGSTIKEYSKYKVNKKKETMFFAIASFLLTISCSVVYIMSILDGTL